MNLLRRLCLLAVVGLGMQALDSHALTTCSAQVSTVAFGTVSSTAATDTTAAITISCNTGALSAVATASVAVCLNIGEGVQSTGLGIVPRRLVSSRSDTLQMQFYKDPARTQVWGSNLLTSSATPLQFNLNYEVPLLGGAGATSQTLYARIPLQSGLAAGSDYGDQFNGGATLLQYRYSEVLLGVALPPPSCVTGGTGGGTAAVSFGATASVASLCRISAASDLDFSTQPGLLSSHRDSTSTVSIACSGRTAWQIGLNEGQHASGGTRRMANAAGTAFASYEMYRDSARTQRWGTTLNADTLSGTGSGFSQTLTIHGRVPGPQNLTPGSYSDTITVVVTY